MENKQYYDNCISLGCFCGTACSLSKMGLRNFSSPFDWCTSYDFSSVINQIDREFIEFMMEENLEICANPKIFRDKKYHFDFPHEIRNEFKIEYTTIYNKYRRRIKRRLVLVLNRIYMEIIKHILSH